MPAKKKIGAGPRVRRTVTEYQDLEEDEREDPLPFDPAEETYSQFVGKFAQEEVRVKVYRHTPNGKEYCFSGSPNEIDDETIRLYHAKQRYAHEAGQYYLHIVVRGELRNAFPVPIAPQVATPGADPAHGGMAQGGGLETVIKLLQEQNARLEARLNERQNEREPIGALADAMLKLQQVQQNQNGGGLTPETLLKCIELGRSMGGGGETDWTKTLLEVAKEAMPSINTLIQSIRPGSASGQQLSDGGQQQGTMNDAQMEVMFKQAVAFLKRKCLAGSDPGLYIDIVIDNRDEPQYQQLIHRVLTQEFPAFASIDPEIEKPPFDEFFRFIYDGLRSAFARQDQVAGDTGGNGGNKTDTKDNVRTVKTRNSGS